MFSTSTHVAKLIQCFGMDLVYKKLIFTSWTSYHTQSPGRNTEFTTKTLFIDFGYFVTELVNYRQRKNISYIFFSLLKKANLFATQVYFFQFDFFKTPFCSSRLQSYHNQFSNNMKSRSKYSNQVFVRGFPHV